MIVIPIREFGAAHHSDEDHEQIRTRSTQDHTISSLTALYLFTPVSFFPFLSRLCSRLSLINTNGHKSFYPLITSHHNMLGRRRERGGQGRWMERMMDGWVEDDRKKYIRDEGCSG